MILSIETSGKYCSVALSHGPSVRAQLADTREFSHSETLAPFVKQVLADGGAEPRDLEAVALSSGPGSYTGLRVGTSFAKAMCFALGIPLIAVDTLEAIAGSAKRSLEMDATYIPNIDARRMEVYLAVFDKEGRRLKENVSAIVETNLIEDLVPGGGSIVFCGNGSAKSAEVLDSPDITMYEMEVNATDLISLALRSFSREDWADVVQFKPQYLKSPNITVSSKPNF